MSKTESRLISADWTQRKTFKLDALPKEANCKGCQKILGAGKLCLFKTLANPNNKSQQMIIAACDEDCLETYDDIFWQSVALANQGLFRTSLTEGCIRHQFGSSYYNHRFMLHYFQV